MTIIRNGAEGGVDATTVTTGNSGGASGDAWNVINLNGGDIEYDNAQEAHGALSYLVQPISGTVTELQWNITSSTLILSFYIRFPSTPAGSVSPTLCQMRNASTSVAGLQLLVTTPKFRVLGAAGATLFNSATVTANTWYRCELRVVRGTTTSNGTIEFAYYAGDSLTPVETAYTNVAANMGTTDLTNIRLGRTSSAASVTDTTAYWVDSVQVLSGSDGAALGNPWAPEKIDLTATRVANDEVLVTWTPPADAPDGITIARGDGDLRTAVDGAGKTSSQVWFDPLTIPITTVSVIQTDDTTGSFSDTGLGGGDYTYFDARTAP